VAVTTESGILLVEGAGSSAILPAVARLPVAIAVGGIGVLAIFLGHLLVIVENLRTSGV
jgi:hypothetical protein